MMPNGILQVSSLWIEPRREQNKSRTEQNKSRTEQNRTEQEQNRTRTEHKRREENKKRREENKKKKKKSRDLRGWFFALLQIGAVFCAASCCWRPLLLPPAVLEKTGGFPISSQNRGSVIPQKWICMHGMHAVVAYASIGRALHACMRLVCMHTHACMCV
jgi:hypothetical protein